MKFFSLKRRINYYGLTWVQERLFGLLSRFLQQNLVDFMLNTGTPSLVSERFFKQISFYSSIRFRPFESRSQIPARFYFLTPAKSVFVT